MAKIDVIKIGKTESTMVALPTAVAISPSVNALDSDKSGRDNNTGAMFRDKITEKLKYTVDLPAGMTNTDVAEILDILLQGSIYVTYPDIMVGAFQTKRFYCSSAEPKIKMINSLTSWKYEAWSFEITEM